MDSDFRRDVVRAGPVFGRVVTTSIHPVISPIAIRPSNEDGWNEGPLPLRLKGGLGTGPRDITADAVSRATYHLPAVAEALGQRWHRHLTGGVSSVEQDVIWAVELVACPGNAIGMEWRRYFVVLHSAIGCTTPQWPADAVRTHNWNDLVNALGPSDWMESLVAQTFKGRPSTHHLRMLTPGVLTKGMETINTSLEGADPLHEWLWLLASCTVGHPGPPYESVEGQGSRLRTYPIDRVAIRKEVEEKAISLSSDWSVLTLRDGTAFVGRRPEDAYEAASSLRWGAESLVMDRRDSFFDDAELFVRTIYCDALLLGEFQRWILADLETANSDAVTSGVGAVISSRRLQRELFVFRRRFWWSVASGGGVSDKLLSAYQDEHRLELRLSQCTEDIAELSVLAAREAETRLGGALALLTSVGIPLGTALAIAELLTVQELAYSARLLNLGISLGGAAIASSVLLWIFPGLRNALRDSIRRWS
jgi:hypothetical protein